MSAHSSQKGGAMALLILVIAATLAILFFGQIHVSLSAIETSKQKQLLDATAKILGNNIIKNGLNHNCSNGLILNESRAQMQQMATELGLRQLPTITCQDLGLITLPNGQTQRNIQVSMTSGVSSHYAQGQTVNRNLNLQLNEQTQPITKNNSSITFILDFSGSMNSNNRRTQLIDAVNQFINARYDIKYGAALFSTDSINPPIHINKGPFHDSQASTRIGNQRAEGNTNFTAGLSQAKSLLNTQPIDKHFFVFITDGDPTAGSEPIAWVRNNIFNIPAENCRRLNPQVNCITIYSLGVAISDNNVQRLISMSGNAATLPNARQDYFYYANNQQIGRAFDNIIANILCKWGPINPLPTNLNDLQNLNVFLNDRPINRNDWEIDETNMEIKLYNQVCDEILENGNNITIRYGKTNLIIF